MQIQVQKSFLFDEFQKLPFSDLDVGSCDLTNYQSEGPRSHSEEMLSGWKEELMCLKTSNASVKTQKPFRE